MPEGFSAGLRLLLVSLLAVLALQGAGLAEEDEVAPGLPDATVPALPGTTVVVGTAPVAGVYYPVGGAICRVVNADRERHGMRCLVESTGGSDENLKRLRAGQLDFALLQSDWQYYAARDGTGRDTGGENGAGPVTGLSAVASLHAQPFTLVAARDSTITAITAIEGQRVNLGPEGSAMRAAGTALLEALGWDEDALAALPRLDSVQQIEALCSGEIDAFLMAVSHPSSVVSAATDRCRARLVPIRGAGVDLLLSAWPFYAPAAIPGGLYRGNPEPVATFGLRATLVTSRAASEAAVYWLARSLFDDLEAFRRQYPALAGLSPEQMISQANTLDFHAGALRYFQERGWR